MVIIKKLLCNKSFTCNFIAHIDNNQRLAFRANPSLLRSWTILTSLNISTNNMAISYFSKETDGIPGRCRRGSSLANNLPSSSLYSSIVSVNFLVELLILVWALIVLFRLIRKLVLHNVSVSAARHTHSFKYRTFVNYCTSTR